MIEEGERETSIHQYDKESARRQIEQLKNFKAERDNRQVTEHLDSVRQAALANENVIPYLIEAAKSYATIGEMNKALQDSLGKWREPAIF